jgi:hypothetical protein
LHRAANYDAVKFAEVLIAAGADIEAKDNDVGVSLCFSLPWLFVLILLLIRVQPRFTAPVCTIVTKSRLFSLPKERTLKPKMRRSVVYFLVSFSALFFIC